MSTNKIEKEVDDFLANNKIKLTIVYDGTKKLDDWECDSWRIKILTDKGIIEFPFHTGKGLRDKELKTPVNPTAAAIFNNVLMNIGTFSTTFHEWCNEFGYESNLRKTRKIYEDCCELERKLNDILSSNQIHHLNALLENY